MSSHRRNRGRANGLPTQPVPADTMVMAVASTEPPVAVAEDAEIVIEVADSPARRPSCTLAQLRRFVKSRPYVPLHELRRRFGIEGYEDEVSSFRGPDGPLYVGLPPEEAQLLGELVRGGEVGYERLLDPTCPAIVGVFPMRPVARS